VASLRSLRLGSKICESVSKLINVPMIQFDNLKMWQFENWLISYGLILQTLRCKEGGESAGKII
jgi:hypothetical protein